MIDRLYIWTSDKSEPQAVDPRELRRTTPLSDIHAFCEIVEEISRLLTLDDPARPPLTFALTWHLDAWRNELDDAVVFLIGDERYQMPGWAWRAKTVFKTGGVRRNSIASTLRLPISLASRLLVRELRDSLIRLRRSAATRKSRGVTIHELPLGTYKLAETPLRPFADRHIDVFFAGSITAGGATTLRPSIVARLLMADAVLKAQAQLADVRFDCSVGAQRGEFALAPGTYSQRLADARVALCPRGNFDETFRHFEAAKMGCVIVTEPLPRRWYYRDLPAVELRDWVDLPKVLATLFADQTALAARSVATRLWWENTASPQSIARWAAPKIRDGGV